MKAKLKRRRRLDVFDVLILAILVAMIVLSPLAMGSVAPWARNSLFVLSLATAALWMLQCAFRGRLAVKKEPLFIFIVLFFAVAGAQLLPLGASTLETISPATAGLYERTLPAAAGASAEIAGNPEAAPSGGGTLSVTPHSTRNEIQRFATFALVFLVIVHTFRTRLQVTVLILAAVAVGSFEAVYGFAEHFSGVKQIFWNQKEFCRLSVSGTFVNKNHFAGFLEMIIPMALGLCMAAAPQNLRGGNIRARLVETVSSTGLHRQVILGALIVIMTLAIFLSLSRAGISCTIVAWIPFFLFIGLATGTRKYTMIILLLILAGLCVFLGARSELTIEKMEEAATGESVSLYGRLDLWESGAGMVRDFPVAGTGLGTFEAAFERYQSPYFGDKIADYAHNDWLQIFCETGLAGGLAATAGMVLLFLSLTRRTVGRRDSFCRWIATGAMAGCGAILVHSLFDFNLYKITSNGLLFAMTFGIWYVAANMEGRTRGSRWKVGEAGIALPGKPVRFALGIVAVAAAALLAVQPVRSAAADIHLNRYIASLDAPNLQDYYFFLPLGDQADDSQAAEAGPAGSNGGPLREELVRARGLDPANPLIVFFEGIDRIDRADALVHERVEAMAADWFGGALPDDGGSEAAQMKQRLFDLALVDLADERRPYLREAEERLEEAVRLAPATSRYHLALANVRGEAELFMREGEDTNTVPGAKAADAALWLAPNKPWVLYHAGRLHLAHALSEPGLLDEDPALRAFIEDCFRRAIAGEPEYAEKIYSLVQNRMGGAEVLPAVTPDTIPALDRLVTHLSDRRDWEGALEALDRLEALCADGDAASAASGLQADRQAGRQYGSPKSPELLHAEAITQEKGSSAYDGRDPLDIRLDVARQRAAALAMLGRFEERSRETQRLTPLLRRKVAEGIARAAELRAARRYHQSFERILRVLQHDWANPEALLFAAELALMPSVADAFASGNRTLDHLFRLVVHNESLTTADADRAGDILAEVKPGTAEEKHLSRLVEGAVLTLSGRAREGASVLQDLIAAIDETGAAWGRRHLVWFYLGAAHEKCGHPEEAVVAYASVLQDVPAHRGALARLAELDPGFQLAAPLPAVVTDIDFGGKARLVGYSLDEARSGAGRFVTFYWQVAEPSGAGCTSRLQFLDADLETLHEDNRILSAVAETSNKSIPPRCGAIILDRRPIPEELGSAGYIRLRVRPQDAPLLTTDSGERDCLLPVAGP